MRYILITVLSVIATLFAAAKDMPFSNVVAALDNYNPQIQIARAKIESNQSAMRVERNLDDPTVEYQLMAPGSANEMELTVSQGFAFPTKYARMKKAEKLAYKRDSLEYELTRKEVIASAYDICAEIVYLNQMVEMDSMRYEMSRVNYDKLKRGLEEGKYNILEANEGQIEMITAYSNYSSTRRALSENYLQLNALLGNNTTLKINDKEYPSNLKECSKKCTLMEQLISVEAEINAQQMKVAKAESHPNLSAGYKMTKAGETAHGFVVGSSIPIFSAKGKKQLVQAESTVANLELSQRAAELEASISNELNRLEELVKLTSMYDKDMFSQSLQLLKKTLDSGRITEIEYATLFHTWYDNNKAYLEQVKELNKSLLKVSVYCED